MRKSLIAIASLALCFGVVACEDEDDADMGVMSGASAVEQGECTAAKSECTAKSSCEETAEASPGVVGDKSHCEGKTGDCPVSGENN